MNVWLSIFQYRHLINPATSTKQPLFNKWEKSIFVTMQRVISDRSLTNSESLRRPGPGLPAAELGHLTLHAAHSPNTHSSWCSLHICLRQTRTLCVCICVCARIHNSWPTAFLNHHQIKEKPTVEKRKPASMRICTSFCCRIPKTLQEPTSLQQDSASNDYFNEPDKFLTTPPPTKRVSWEALVNHFPPNVTFLLIHWKSDGSGYFSNKLPCGPY